MTAPRQTLQEFADAFGAAMRRQREQREAAARIQDLSDAGHGTPEEVATALHRATTAPVTEPLQTSGPREAHA